ncbi:MAG: hypothetical protein ACJA1A_000249 [Saprospiraceae bacterium]
MAIIYSNQVVVDFVNVLGYLIYPNTPIDQLSVLSKNENLQKSAISVLDIGGKLVYRVIVPSKSDVRNEKIHVGNWDSGIYYILLYNEVVSHIMMYRTRLYRLPVFSCQAQNFEACQYVEL